MGGKYQEFGRKIKLLLDLRNVLFVIGVQDIIVWLEKLGKNNDQWNSC